MKHQERSTTFDMSNPGGCSTQSGRTPFTPENNKLLIRTYEESRGVGSTCRTLSNVRSVRNISSPVTKAQARAAIVEAREARTATSEEKA